MKVRKDKYLKLNTNISPIYAKNITEFNSYVEKYKTENTIVLTKENNISQSTLFQLPASKTWKRGNKMEFHYIDDTKHIRVLYAIAYENQEQDPLISVHALNYFKGLMELIPTDDKEEDIELFTCPENPLSTYYNYCNSLYTEMTIDNCYSLDRNNSFPASMAEVYPQTRPYVEKYYHDRLNFPKNKKPKEYQEFKLYGSIFVGWLKIKNRHKAWKKIIDHSNRTVHKLRQQIEAAGNTVLLVNTDAIKFIGHYDYEGSTELGQFKYEWEDAKMYIKGVKSYAYFIDKWEFKQAGKTNLDKLKPRDQWTLEEFKTFNIEMLQVRIKNNNYLYETY